MGVPLIFLRRRARRTRFDFLAKTRSLRYGAARAVAQTITDQLIVELILCECGMPYSAVEEKIIGCLTQLIVELSPIVTGRQARELYQQKEMNP